MAKNVLVRAHRTEPPKRWGHTRTLVFIEGRERMVGVMESVIIDPSTLGPALLVTVRDKVRAHQLEAHCSMVNCCCVEAASAALADDATAKEAR